MGLRRGRVGVVVSHGSVPAQLVQPLVVDAEVVGDLVHDGDGDLLDHVLAAVADGQRREPDRILIFRGPLLDMCSSEEQLVDEVRITVVHEIAHHFGIDDRALHGLGYG